MPSNSNQTKALLSKLEPPHERNIINWAIYMSGRIKWWKLAAGF